MPLEHVAEVMRPLPIEPLAQALAFVLGVAIVRGLPAPVLDAGRLMGGAPSNPTRFISLKLGARVAVLAVDSVLGIRTLPDSSLAALPPLLDTAALAAVGSLDRQLLLVLRTAALIPDEIWRALENAA